MTSLKCLFIKIKPTRQSSRSLYGCDRAIESCIELMFRLQPIDAWFLADTDVPISRSNHIIYYTQPIHAQLGSIFISEVQEQVYKRCQLVYVGVLRISCNEIGQAFLVVCILSKGEVFSDWLEISGMHKDDLCRHSLVQKYLTAPVMFQ